MVASRAMSFGDEVRRRRKANGWTLEVLAERAGLSPHYLSTVETGSRDPSLSTIVSLAMAFDVAPGQLLGQLRGLSPAAQEAAELVEALPTSHREPWLTVLRLAVGHRQGRAGETTLRSMSPALPNPVESGTAARRSKSPKKG